VFRPAPTTMSPIRPPAWMQREARAVAGPRLVAPAVPGDSSAAVTRRRGESRRIVVGLVTLGVLLVVMLNLGIYQSARRVLVDGRWEELVNEANEKRRAARARIREYESHARFLAGQPHLRGWVTPTATPLTPDARATLVAELERAAGSFGFHAIGIFTPGGRFVAGTASARVTPSGLAEVQRAVEGRREAIGGFRRGQEGATLLYLAVPVARPGAEDCVAVALFEIRADEALMPALADWNGFGADAGAYLVAKSGHEVVYLTPAPGGHAPAAGDHASLMDPLARAAATAALGLESNVEWEDARGRHMAAVTRNLPELGWGLVGQMSGAAMAEGTRSTLAGLLTLDGALLTLAFAALWLWRRQYAIGLARREAEVSRGHAERVQAVFDTAFDAILTFDRTGCILGVNRAAESLFGRPAAEIVDQPLHRFLAWDGARRASDLPVPGAVCRADVRREGRDPLPVEFSIGTSGSGDEMVYTAIVRDISERVAAEQRIREFTEGLEVGNRRLEEANLQLEEASRLKSEFLANTSHELRTPLNGMIGFLQLVLDGLCDSPEEEREFIKQALQCSRHLLGLINDVLDIAKIEAGKLGLDIQRLDIQTVFDEVYTLTHVQAAQRDLALHFVFGSEPPRPGRGDPGKLKQVLVNLIGNSLKFTPRGSITVRATVQERLGHILFEVEDTGIGIPADRQRMIFDKFTQADGSTTRKYGGTGLGLAITRSLVELMGGVIGVRSAGEGRGTCVYFTLPLWRDEAESPGAEPPIDRIAGAAGGALVLVVEDDPTFRRFVATLLQSAGYRTVEATGAESAWRLACRLRPAAVVTDYAMTCSENAALRTGWDLAERMSREAATRDIPVVIVTGFEDELRGRVRAGTLARRPEHLLKPVDPAALIARLEQMVGPSQGRAIRILMVDDDPTVAAFVRKVLPQGRFHIEMAANGEEGLQVLRSQPLGFDVLLLDLMMPDVSGYDVLRAIAAESGRPNLPVLVLTNYPEPRTDEERALLEHGPVLEVLPKTSVHDNPSLLPHIIGWHLQRGEGPDAAGREAA
jgi:PAS domain S-box-containing protein